MDSSQFMEVSIHYCLAQFMTASQVLAKQVRRNHSFFYPLYLFWLFKVSSTHTLLNSSALYPIIALLDQATSKKAPSRTAQGTPRHNWTQAIILHPSTLLYVKAFIPSQKVAKVPTVSTLLKFPRPNFPLRFKADS